MRARVEGSSEGWEGSNAGLEWSDGMGSLLCTGWSFVL